MLEELLAGKSKGAKNLAPITRRSSVASSVRVPFMIDIGIFMAPLNQRMSLSGLAAVQ